MKAMQMLKVVLVGLFLFSGLVGCASTPPVAQMDDQAKISQSDMNQAGSEVKGVDANATQGEVAPSHDAVAGMERIYFDFDQFTLSAEARLVIAKNAKYLQANGGVKAVIEGHCDERGSDEYNLALGESRALAAKNHLISLGISAARLSVISYGEEMPLRTGSAESVWSQNRRAEFKVVN